MTMNDARPSTRYELDASASYQCVDVEGEGTIANISLSGALLEPASPALLRAPRSTSVSLASPCPRVWRFPRRSSAQRNRAA